jgi:hypothetical protein
MVSFSLLRVCVGSRAVFRLKAGKERIWKVREANCHALRSQAHLASSDEHIFDIHIDIHIDTFPGRSRQAKDAANVNIVIRGRLLDYRLKQPDA